MIKYTCLAGIGFLRFEPHTFQRLEEWVNDPLDEDIQCLEIEKKVYSKLSA